MTDWLWASVGFCLGWLSCVLWNKFWFHVATRQEDLRHAQAMNMARESEAEAEAEKKWNEAIAIGPVFREPDETAEGIHRQQWLTRLGLFLAAGDRLGFSNRAMCPEVLSNRHWGPLTAHLVGCGVLDQDQAGTRWAAGWDLARAREALKELPLPTFALCDVRWGGNATRQVTPVTPVTLSEGHNGLS